MSWKRQSFEITVLWINEERIGKRLVDGETNGYFGISGKPYNYTLTHLPTGHSFDNLAPGNMKFTKKNWLKIYESIKDLSWDFITPEGVKSIKDECKKRVKDLQF